MVKLGGFGRAAERLHMTQPAVSARISQIEARYQIRLLDRSSHRAPVPTAKGLELYSYAERILALGAELVGKLQPSSDFAGTIRIGAAETLVHTLIGSLIHRLHALHPNVTPEVTVDITPNLHAGLLNGELDVALLMGPINEPRMRNIALCDYELCWVASPVLALAQRRLNLADLAEWPILSYARGTLPHTQLAGLFRHCDTPARIFANSSLASILRMAIDGIGVGILPHALVARDIAEGRLVLLDAEPKMPPLRFTASYIATPASGLAEVVAVMASELAIS